MTPRQLHNLAKYFFDLSKLTLTVSVISQLVGQENINMKVIVFGATTSVLLLSMAVWLDWREEDD